MIYVAVAVLTLTTMLLLRRTWCLERAIRRFLRKRGHDRCWENELELRAALRGDYNWEPPTELYEMSDEEFLGECKAYLDSQRRRYGIKP